MWSNKVLVVIVFFMGFSSGPLFANERVKAVDIVKYAPHCYVTREMLNIRNPVIGVEFRNFFVNYMNASNLLGEVDNDQVSISIRFYEATMHSRKGSIDYFANLGYDIEFFKNLYIKHSCGTYEKVIESKDIDL